MKTHTKMIAASLSLMATAHVFAGVGGLNVQSNLGEPFSGSIVVTGREAEALIKSGSVSVSGNGIQGTVVPQGNNKALIRLRSSAAINDPVVNLTVKAGNQTRQYTVMVNPANYRPRAANKATTTRTNTASAQQIHKRAETTISVPQGPFSNDYNPNRQTAKMQPENSVEYVRKSPTAQQRVRSVRPRYYRAHNGESLASIAARYRPHGMSVQRAMRGLVAANPRAFRNGNPNSMYRNVTLYIPTASQWYAYSNRRIHKTHSPRLAAQPNTNKSAIVKPSVQPSQAVVPPSQTETVANTQQNQAASPQPTQSDNTQQEPIQEKQVEKPVEIATTPAFASDNKPKETTEVASAPITVASATQVAAASTPIIASAETASVASNAITAVASQASQTSTVAASSEVTAAPPKPQKRPPMPTAEEPVEEEGFDWLGLGLPIGAGLLVLGGSAAYLINRRRKANAADDEDDGDVSFDDDSEEWAVAPVATSTATQASDVEAEWDLPETTPSFETSDELFDLPAEETISSVQTASNTSAQDFDLNNFEPDNLADFSVDTTAPEEDFDWAVSEEPVTPAAVAVETEESWEVNTNLLSQPSTATNTLESSSDEEWLLNESFTTSETSAVATTNSVEIEEDWSNNTFVVEETAPITETSSPESIDDIFNLDLPTETATTNSLDEFDINLPETSVDFTSSEAVDTTIHDEVLDFDLDLSTAVVAGAATTVVAATIADNVDISSDMAVNLDAPSAPIDSLDEFSLDLPTKTAVQDVSGKEISLDDFGLELPTETTTPEIAVDDFGLELPTIEEPAISLDAPIVETTDFNLNDIPEVTDSVISLDTPDIAVDDFGLELPTEPVTEVSLDDFDLDMTVEEPQTSIPVADEIGMAFDDNLSVGIDEPVQIETIDNSLSFTDDVSLNIEEPVQTALVTDDLSLSIDEPVQDTPITDDLSLSIDEPVQNTPITDDSSLSVDEPVQNTPITDDLSLSVDEPVQDIPIADDLSFNMDEPAAPPTLTVEESLDTSSWDIADAPKEVGFVSESVDMTAPMEARLELAKMYLEIDDAVAARETLRELINESSGDVQHQAKQLLNELGG
ncbi:hypothetical protein MHM91_08550 [Neisseriaceae bacterium CCUG 44465]|uniref:FimV/HubP family polar landmark protein n=2 Tax=Wielerella bovis TaxID=2917790 RepID=UPI0020199C7A|nr:FimV/HubP family polar landmark protein [Wielerella bovis]MCG7659749.1 hypothetical protein [Wielerella bovis]